MSKGRPGSIPESDLSEELAAENLAFRGKPTALVISDPESDDGWSSLRKWRVGTEEG